MNHFIARTSAEQGYTVLDTASPVRVAIGLGAGYVGIPPWVAILGLIGYQAARIGWFRVERETPANQAADVVLTISGFYLGRWIRGRVP